MNRLALALLVALATGGNAVAAGCPEPGLRSVEARAEAQALDDYALAVAANATSGGGARELVSAAGWLRTVDRARDDRESLEADQMLARAAVLAGDDPIAWFMLAQACAEPCAIEPDPDARWLELDRDNAAAWSDELVRAQAAGDAGRARAALASAAAASRFDWYWLESIQASMDAARRVPMSDAVLRAAAREGIDGDDAIVAYAVGVSLAQTLPPVNPMIEACSANPDWRADCLRLAETMEDRGDTLLAQGVGRSIARRLLATGSAEAEALAARDRRYRWQTFNFARLGEIEPPSRALARLVENRSEPGAFEAQLRDAGVALDPPPGWSPEAAAAELAKRHPPPDPAVLEACEPSKR